LNWERNGCRTVTKRQEELVRQGDKGEREMRKKE